MVPGAGQDECMGPFAERENSTEKISREGGSLSLNKKGHSKARFAWI